MKQFYIRIKANLPEIQLELHRLGRSQNTNMKQDSSNQKGVICYPDGTYWITSFKPWFLGYNIITFDQLKELKPE